MTFLFGYAIGSVVTVFLIYQVGKKKKAEAEKKLVSNAQSLNKQNSEEGDEDEL